MLARVLIVFAICNVGLSVNILATGWGNSFSELAFSIVLILVNIAATVVLIGGNRLSRVPGRARRIGLRLALAFNVLALPFTVGTLVM